MTKEDMNEKETILEEVKQAGEVSKSIGKLLKDRVLVEFNPNQSELDVLESDELTLKSKLNELKSEEVELKESIVKALDEISKKQKELSDNKVRAYLVPLKYRDTTIVKASITEAMLTVENYGFDTDVKIIMIMREKKLMTVYLSLRKYNNINEKYFKDGDEGLKQVSELSNETIDKLYEEYIKEFLLTDEERKKS